MRFSRGSKHVVGPAIDDLRPYEDADADDARG